MTKFLLTDLSRATIGFLVDGVDAANFGYTRRMVYNMIRMYSLSGMMQLLSIPEITLDIQTLQ